VLWLITKLHVTKSGNRQVTVNSKESVVLRALSDDPQQFLPFS